MIAKRVGWFPPRIPKRWLGRSEAFGSPETAEQPEAGAWRMPIRTRNGRSALGAGRRGGACRMR